MKSIEGLRVSRSSPEFPRLHGRFVPLAVGVADTRLRPGRLQAFPTLALPQEILAAVSEDHRGWLERKLASSHEPFLDQRLHEIFSRHMKVAQAVVGRKKKVRADFIDQVVNARNYRAHFPERLEGRAARGAELHPFNVKLKKLLEACLMGEIGFEDDEIKKAVTGLR